jgi:hypothetical protein
MALTLGPSRGIMKNGASSDVDNDFRSINVAMGGCSRTAGNCSQS